MSDSDENEHEAMAALFAAERVGPDSGNRSGQEQQVLDAAAPSKPSHRVQVDSLLGGQQYSEGDGGGGRKRARPALFAAERVGPDSGNRSGQEQQVLDAAAPSKPSHRVQVDSLLGGQQKGDGGGGRLPTDKPPFWLNSIAPWRGGNSEINQCSKRLRDCINPPGMLDCVLVNYMFEFGWLLKVSVLR
eukprot:SAG31_NODE_13_length_37961_cov_21.751307_25_plen_188_part_00